MTESKTTFNILGADKAKTTADGRFAVDGERTSKKDH